MYRRFNVKGANYNMLIAKFALNIKAIKIIKQIMWQHNINYTIKG